MKNWLIRQGFDAEKLQPLMGDASFRHYFRIIQNGQSYIVMDAPPDKEKPQAFYDLTGYLREYGVHTPQVYHADLKQGWLVIEDFGQVLLSQVIATPQVLSRYQQAVDIAAHLLQMPLPPHIRLPAFDAAKQLTELQLFSDWFIQTHLEYVLNAEEEALLAQSYALIIEKLVMQPQVLVHRDFHCRNLMVLDKGLGVIDFQDAVIGPYAYDFVSLLKDAYTDYAYQQSDLFCELLWDKMPMMIKKDLTYQQFLDDVHWTGIQRHLKVIGIFSRLYRRDGKSSYLHDIPLVFNYLMDALGETPELDSLYQWIKQTILPRYQQQKQSVSV